MSSYHPGSRSSDRPLLENHGLEREATPAVTEAYAIACRSLHPGRVPTTQDFLARKIMESAQLGERDPARLAQMALSKLNAFHRDATNHFGLIPEFFVSAPDAPEILERLWEFAKSAYISNPMPSVFKERLFVFLSRFCPVRYCIIRHCGFLIGYGYASGDPSAVPQSIDKVIKLLEMPAPWRRQLEPVFRTLGQVKKPIDWPPPDDLMEDGIFALAALIFVEHAQAERARQTLRQLLGGSRLEYFLALLAFIRTAHFWTLQHPGLQIEDDMRELMTKNKKLANLLLEDPDLGYRSTGLG